MRGLPGGQLSGAAPAATAATPIDADAPIGVFDSGIGGLSVLRHVHARLPHERLLYFADTAHAPYGERTETAIAQRALAVGALLQQRGVKALVVACNTATAAAIAALRERHTELVVIGVEPGLKPAALLSRRRMVGVMATPATLASPRFEQLRAAITLATGVGFTLQACAGLADCIERGELQAPATRALLERFIPPLLAAGADTLVLGCTHYPFVLPMIEEVLKAHGCPDVACVDTGAAVARQLERALAGRRLLQKAPARADATDNHKGHTSALFTRSPAAVTAFAIDDLPAPGGPGTGVITTGGSGAALSLAGRIDGVTTGAPAALQQAFARLLEWDVEVTSVPA